MASILSSLFFTFHVLLMGGEAGAYSYFAAVTNLQLRPYFNAHGMESDSHDAYLIFIYLVAAAVVLWSSFVLTIRKLCRRNETSSSDNERSSSLLLMVEKFISLVLGIAFVIFACLTAKRTWDWWGFFEAEGVEHLAKACHAMTSVVITSLVLTSVVMIIAVTTTIKVLGH
ncbi:hypothetical protein GGR54DRAFT_586810 [Hypoxylon sp. NC1633]|nr:hypothetical protein GGR54DRAFT_586810 [Hypoxylon sp. NC1633]